jgi:hypothetical protein
LKKEDGYVCKCCGVWFRYQTEEEKLHCAIGYRYLRTYNFEAARTAFEETLDNFPQSIDARWGLLLSRFGVVFIKGFYDDVIEPVYCFPDYEELEGREYQAGDIFFTKDGAVWHTDINCKIIVGAQKIYFADVSTAKSLGKSQACSECEH